MLLPHPAHSVTTGSTSYPAPPLQANVTTETGHDRPSVTVRPAQACEITFSTEDRDKIFAIYFQYRHRLIGRVHPSYIAHTLDAQDENLRPHPALVDTILLVGIMLAHLTEQSHLLPSVLPDTDQFLAQIHRKLGVSFELVDRLFDHLQASLLVCGWYFYNGRLQEAQYFSASTFRLAIVYQLHRIDGCVIREDLSDRVATSFWEGTILGRPQSRNELHTRILSFWNCYACERLSGLITGLPMACDETAITTVWPHLAESFELNGAFDPGYPKSIQELFSREVKFMKLDEWMLPVLLGRAIHLLAVTESLEPEDRSALENVVQEINTLANVMRVYDSTLQHLDEHMPPYQSIKSCTNAKTWCIALQARMGGCAVHVHILRSIETVKKLLSSLGDSSDASIGGAEQQTWTTFADLVPKDGNTFQDVRFAFARRGIKITYEVARQHVEDDPLGFASTKWLTHLPNLCGFVLPSLLLPVVDSIHDLTTKIATLPASETTALQTLSALLDDAEITFTQGMQVMNLLSTNMIVLKFQVDKMEQARYPTLQP